VDPLSLHAGDLVVHAQHGVGRFIELSRRTVGGARSSATREYLVIEYAPSKRGQPGDRLLVPTDALDQVTKYVGGDSPALSKMGGADWAKTKSKARKAVREIAGELVRLYAARAATTGHAFSPDTPWQTELEEAFPYTETPDQLSTIDEVKADMEKAQPMDRLRGGGRCRQRLGPAPGSGDRHPAASPPQPAGSGAENAGDAGSVMGAQIARGSSGRIGGIRRIRGAGGVGLRCRSASGPAHGVPFLESPSAVAGVRWSAMTVRNRNLRLRRSAGVRDESEGRSRWGALTIAESCEP